MLIVPKDASDSTISIAYKLKTSRWQNENVANNSVSEEIPVVAGYITLKAMARKQKIRIHDYNTMYAQPGLYEYNVHELLACESPRILVQFLNQHLASSAVSENLVGPSGILDVAAGKGIVGAELRKQLTGKPGIRSLIDTNLLEMSLVSCIKGSTKRLRRFCGR
ncbi:hypothetical protein HO173_004697 [Letharia columbiana]|uniref:Uncharacterized protein n=1 Tax=Letharia columbiana TaxID=112416 RepID=A0A8H6FYQ2_9LECA|nr:uncharacterized protein HO173_004697 [Letharia columbiana]KAF6237229.1 hypothetical protein HO173_004697 [Letharia columbiana]